MTAPFSLANAQANLAEYEAQVASGRDAEWAAQQVQFWQEAVQYHMGRAARASAPVLPAREPVQRDDAAREERVKRIIEDHGVNRAEAERRVRVADNEPITEADIVAMSSAEREAYIRTFSPSVLGLPDADAPVPTPEEQAANEAAAWEAMKPPAPIGVDYRRVDEIQRQMAVENEVSRIRMQRPGVSVDWAQAQAEAMHPALAVGNFLRDAGFTDEDVR